FATSLEGLAIFELKSTRSFTASRRAGTPTSGSARLRISSAGKAASVEFLSPATGIRLVLETLLESRAVRSAQTLEFREVVPCQVIMFEIHVRNGALPERIGKIGIE